MNDTPLLKTPGEMISEARGVQGLTLAQLSDRTKIPPPVLAALELDEYHKISGPLYIKSFLRTCAMDLDLDPETVLGLYNKISGEKKQGAPGSETVWGEDDVQVSRIGLPWLKIVFVVGVVAVVVGFGLFSLRGCGPSGPAQENEVVDFEAPVEAAASAEDAGPPADPDPTPEADSTRPDTLALGWILKPDLPDLAKTAPEPSAAEVDRTPDIAGETEKETATEPEVINVPEPKPVQDPVRQPAEEPVPEQVPEKEPETVPAAEPAAVISGPTSDANEAVAEPMERRDSSWPLVLSIVCPTPRDIQVKRDDDRAFSTVSWPGEGESAPGIPPAGFEAGRVYQQDDRWVIYWGGNDHFGVILGRVSGVVITLNGHPLDTSRFKSGKEFLLDAQSVGAKTDR